VNSALCEENNDAELHYCSGVDVVYFSYSLFSSLLMYKLA